MVVTSEKVKELEKAAEPLIKFLNSLEFHPHVKIIVTPTTAELVEGSCMIKNEDHLRD